MAYKISEYKHTNKLPDLTPLLLVLQTILALTINIQFFFALHLFRSLLQKLAHERERCNPLGGAAGQRGKHCNAIRLLSVLW